MGKRFHGNGNEGWFWEKDGHKLRRAGKENDSLVGSHEFGANVSKARR